MLIMVPVKIEVVFLNKILLLVYLMARKLLILVPIKLLNFVIALGFLLPKLLEERKKVCMVLIGVELLKKKLKL